MINIEVNKINKLRYVVCDEKETYYELKDIESFLNLKTTIIKATFEILYMQIMYNSFLEKLIEEDSMTKEDIKLVKEKLNSVPYYDMLYTQEFLEMVLIERIGEEEFSDYKADLEENFITMTKEHFGFKQ